MHGYPILRDCMTFAGYAGDVEQQDLVPQTPALHGATAQDRSDHDAGEISGPANSGLQAILWITTSCGMLR